MRNLTPAEKRLAEIGIQQPEDIDVEALCQAYDINVRYEPLEKADAFMFPTKNGRTDFLINSNSQIVRQRFSIAHELGHFFLHKGKNFLCQSSELHASAFLENRPAPEKAADQFAANLLIPPFMLVPRIKGFEKVTFQVIKNFANEFETSLPAMAIQIAKSGIFPVVIVFFGRNKKRQFFIRSKFVDKKLWPPEIIPSGAYAYDVSESQPLTEGLLPADEWFDDINEDIDIFEESHYWHGQIVSILTIEDERLLAD